MKELIHFAHGNGFPSACYQQLFLALNDVFDCCYVDMIGHSDEFPVSQNWTYLVHEVIANIKSKAHQPVIGVGHSLGGVLSILAAMESPTLFKMVILLDSPLINRFKSKVVRVSKVLGMIDHLTPAFHTRKRQQHWKSREEAWSYLKSKNLFKQFTDACIEDYIDYGLQKYNDEYYLRFDRELEYQIYRTIPHTLHRYEGKLKVPAVLIYGRDSTVIDKLDREYMRKKYGIQSMEIPGTHMFPMECPEETARLIKTCWHMYLSHEL